TRCRDILKRKTILARIVDVSSILTGEYHENEVRKDFTPSERVRPARPGWARCTAPELCIFSQAGPERVRVPGVLSSTPISRAGGAPCGGFTWSSSWSS